MKLHHQHISSACIQTDRNTLLICLKKSLTYFGEKSRFTTTKADNEFGVTIRVDYV